MYTQICAYVKNTQLPNRGAALEVEEIFQVSRCEEELRYAPYEDNSNRQLLFHVRLDLFSFFYQFCAGFGQKLFFTDESKDDHIYLCNLLMTVRLNYL